MEGEKFPADSTVNLHFQDTAFWSQLVGTKPETSAKRPLLYVGSYLSRRSSAANDFAPSKSGGRGDRSIRLDGRRRPGFAGSSSASSKFVPVDRPKPPEARDGARARRLGEGERPSRGATVAVGRSTVGTTPRGRVTRRAKNGVRRRDFERSSGAIVRVELLLSKSAIARADG